MTESLETQISALHQNIIAHLRVNSSGKNECEIARAVREDEDRPDALTIQASGYWAVKCGSVDGELGDMVPLPILLVAYASITSEEFCAIDFDAIDEQVNFVRTHKKELMDGLVSDMEKALKQLSA